MVRRSYAEDDYYGRLEYLWMTLLSRGFIATSHGWRSDENGTSDFCMINLSHAQEGDLLYRNVMEHDAQASQFFVIYTTIAGVRHEAEVHSDRPLEPLFIPLVEYFLNNHRT